MPTLSTLILFFAGILAGLYGSTVGSGGLISLPATLLATGLPIHAAMATNRFAAIFLDLSSSVRFHVNKHLDLKHGLILGFIAATGAVIGTKLLIQVDEKYLQLTVAILLVGVSLFMFFQDKLGITEKPVPHKHWWAICSASFLLGIYGGFFGTGFGTLIGFVFLLEGYTFIKSAALSRAIGTLVSLSSTIIFAYEGIINYPYAIVLSLGFAIGAWIGAGYGIKKGNNYIKALFLMILVVTVVKLVWEFLK